MAPACVGYGQPLSFGASNFTAFCKDGRKWPGLRPGLPGQHLSLSVRPFLPPLLKVDENGLGCVA